MALIDEIRALPPGLRATKNTQAIADYLPPRVIVESREIGKGAIILALGKEMADVLLDEIDTNPVHRHVKHLIANGWFDVGLDMSRQAVDALIGVVPGFTAEHAAAIKALAERTVPVDEFEVRKLCWSDDGQWLV